jgi:3-hydroxybutyryl-CoA dehydrogenase
MHGGAVALGHPVAVPGSRTLTTIRIGDIMNSKTIMVVGAGTMGAGIAQLAAQQGFQVILADLDLNLAGRGLERIRKSLAARVAKGKMTQAESDLALSRVSLACELSAASAADYVIESITEELQSKQQVFAELDRYARPEAILATNTTSLSISEIAKAAVRPERVLQIHFFNPPLIMQLVEIMPGGKTTPDALKAAEDLVKRLGKAPVICNREGPGGIVSRILGALINEATWLVEQEVASPDEIDRAMKLGANHPMGPLELCDLIGLDVHRAKMQNLRNSLRDPRYQHPPVVDKMIADGRLGRKCGMGFFPYHEPAK